MTVVAPTVREHLENASARLAAAGVESPRVDAEWLLAAALGVRRGGLYTVSDDALPEALAERYEAWVRRRASRVPLQHILGTQTFRDVTVRVSPDVLVPRGETELLVSWALELLPAAAAERTPLVIDVGTGSGCIACALAWERPDLRVLALDASPPAAALAGANAETLGISDRVTVCVSDLFARLSPTRADLIVSNPPYLRSGEAAALSPEVRDHEPRMAIDGGGDGLGVIRRLVSEAPRWLRPGAPLVLETGGGEHADAVTTLLREAGFADVTTRRDFTGVTRFVSGRGGESPVRG